MGLFTRELLVIKKPPELGDDPGVAEFGLTRPRRTPAERNPHPDTTDKQAFKSLKAQAISRALHFGYGIGDVADVPVLFPNGEHYKDQPFDKDHWERFGNLESEHARIDFTLTIYGQQRGFPREFGPYVNTALLTRDTLGAWEEASSCIAQASKGIYQTIRGEMVEKKFVDPEAQKEGYTEAYQSRPILYETKPDVVRGEQTLWDRALTQIAEELQRGDYRHLGSFLDLYTRIKDPITPVTQTLARQESLFRELLRSARSELRKQGITNIATEEGKTLLAQLALESSFLALPAAQSIFYMRGDAQHHAIPYVYTDLKDLPRGEYTTPQAVLPRLTEILDNAEDNATVVITPIAVSYFQTPGEPKPTMFVIDGNNRATALMVMQYLYTEHPTYEERLNPATLKNFMQKHKLHPGWERELILTLKAQDAVTTDGVTPSGFTRELYNRIMTDQPRLRKVVRARVPAMLVQEPNFHTIEVESSERYRPDIFLLQPMHQAIYNHDDLAMAIPPKKQTHGRAPGNNVLVEATRRPRFGIRRRYKVREEQVA